jgi:hypothetical protein
MGKKGRKEIFERKRKGRKDKEERVVRKENAGKVGRKA